MMILAQAQSTSLAPALIGAATALFVAVVAAGLGYWRYLRERADEQETLVNALFGELANIYEHYSYAACELPAPSAPDLPLRLRWSIYGDLRCTQDISEWGFLSAADIRLLLQLGLRMRNNDSFLEALLADQSAIKARDLHYAQERMEYGIRTTRELLKRLAAPRPRLQEILKALENDLSSIQNVA